MNKYLSSFILLRIPFSLFLMPIFWFSLSNVNEINWIDAASVFVIIHLFLYSASNGYNSYFDRDKSSIGGLKKPPKVTKELLCLVAVFDLFALGLSLLISWEFALMVLFYTLVSKAYSNDRIRLKKYPILGTFTVVTVQGAFTYLMVQVGLQSSDLFTINNMTFALISTTFICGSYPLTQIYQHQEDRERGDMTLSLLLGVKRTFIFSTLCMLLGTVALLWQYAQYDAYANMLLFLGFNLPVGVYLIHWMRNTLRDKGKADYANAMRMNKISSLCFSGAFISIILWL